MNLVKFKKESDILNDTFKSIFNAPFYGAADSIMNPSNYNPRVRITEDRDNFYIRMEMPGITKEDLKINLENNVLSVSGTKRKEERKEDANLIMNEIYYGEFCRSFNISNDIKTDGIEAEFKDGVINISLPKVEEAKPVVKEIKVK